MGWAGRPSKSYELANLEEISDDHPLLIRYVLLDVLEQYLQHCNDGHRQGIWCGHRGHGPGDQSFRVGMALTDPW